MGMADVGDDSQRGHDSPKTFSGAVAHAFIVRGQRVSLARATATRDLAPTAPQSENPANSAPEVSLFRSRGRPAARRRGGLAACQATGAARRGNVVRFVIPNRLQGWEAAS
jgi:hypothetical protein